MRSAPSGRVSTVNGAGPSALSKFSVYSDAHEQDLAPDPDFEPANQDFDFDPPANDSPSQRGTSFNHEDEDNDLAEVEEMALRTKKVDKGKQRATVEVEQQEENGIEQDIAQGLEEVENAPDDREGDPVRKKPRKDDQKNPKPKKRAPKRVIQLTEESAFSCPISHT